MRHKKSPTEASQGSAEDGAVQGATHGVQGVQGFWGVGFQGLGASSTQNPYDDADERSHVEGFIGFPGCR